MRIFAGLMALLATPLWGVLPADFSPVFEPAYAPLALMAELLAFMALIYGARGSALVGQALGVAVGLVLSRFVCCLVSAGMAAVLFAFTDRSFGVVFFQMWMGVPLTMLIQIIVTMQVARDVLSHLAPGLLGVTNQPQLAAPKPLRASAESPFEAPPTNNFHDLGRLARRLPVFQGFAIFATDGMVVWSDGPDDDEWVAFLEQMPRLASYMERATVPGHGRAEDWVVCTAGMMVLGGHLASRYRLVATCLPQGDANERRESFDLLRQSAAALLQRRYGGKHGRHLARTV